MNSVICAFGLVAAHAGLLVSTSELASLKGALAVDARTSKEFAAGHIPGALNVDCTALSETREGVAGLLKPLDAVRAGLGAAGVDPAKHIVVYCAMDKPGDLATAARLFWILDYIGYENLSVLDGGLAKWTAEGRATETGAPTALPVTLPEMKVKTDRIATAQNVDLIVTQHNATIVDARGPEYYRGEKKADVVKQAGHIPGAVNLSVDGCVAADGRVKSIEELMSIATTSGVDKHSPVVTYCNTGRSASTAYLLLRLLGYENVSMYDGSMAEWTASGARAVETADKK